MSKNAPYSGNWRISEMASHLPEEAIGSVDPLGDSSLSPSSDRIKQLALQKRRDYLKENEAASMKKTVVRIILVAALVSLMSITAFAALGGLEFMKAIFGDSAASLQNEIVAPQISASADGRQLALEAVLTDGFVTNLVVSLTGERPPETGLFTATTDIGLRSYGWGVLDEFTVKDKTYYAVDFFSEQRFESVDISLSLNRDVAPIDLSIPVKNNLGNAVVNFPEGALSGNTQLTELQVSPMGFLLICHEDDAQGGLPPTYLLLKFSDGRQEDLEVEFDPGPDDERVGGGGGAIMVDDPADAPLVVVFQGMRNPDGELVVNGRFSRIISPDKLEAVVVEGVEYPVQ